MTSEFHPHLETLPIRTFAAVVGWSLRKCESKIERKAWKENREFVYDPDGEIHIIIEGYQEWVKSGQGSKRGKKAFKSGSTIRESGAGSDSSGHPPKPTWIEPTVSAGKSHRRLN